METVKTYAEALEFAKELDVILVPYELEEGMKATMSIIEAIRPDSLSESSLARGRLRKSRRSGRHEMQEPFRVTLGRRILRTETAGITTLSILMYHLECAEVQ